MYWKETFVLYNFSLRATFENTLSKP